MAPIPITIVTGFLGSGKTTLILNLIPQLPKDYKIALLKNEFGDVAIDSQLAASASISGVQELLNGCICCNLVGQLGDALETLRKDVSPDRIIIETSGSAFPATLAIEMNRLARDTGHYTLDGVVVVIDVENWKGYEDTSYTAKMQAKYTDLMVFNKWERVDERKYEDCLDRVGDLELQVATVRSNKGRVDQAALLGLDGTMARNIDPNLKDEMHGEGHDHEAGHQSEVEVLTVTLFLTTAGKGVNLESLETFLLAAPKDEIYRIKAIVKASQPPAGSGGDVEPATIIQGQPTAKYILNWAFGRWTFTPLIATLQNNRAPSLTASSNGDGTVFHDAPEDAVLRMTVVLARGEAQAWGKRIEAQGCARALAKPREDVLRPVARIVGFAGSLAWSTNHPTHTTGTFHSSLTTLEDPDASLQRKEQQHMRPRSKIVCSFVFLLVLTLALRRNARSSDLQSRCLAFAPETHISNSTHQLVQYVTAGTNLTFPFNDPTCHRSSQAVSTDLCRIALSIRTSDRSSITFELWLPSSWSGRLLGTGNGGIDGCIKYEDLTYATHNGFASFGSNNGHNGTTGVAFYHNHDVVEDFAWRALHISVTSAKELVKQFYGEAHEKSYYLGCSLGGRQGVKAAESFPSDFDGIVAGSPALDFNNLVSWRANFFPIVGHKTSLDFIEPSTWTTLIHDEVLRQCDGIDGVLDGIIEDPNICPFRPDAMLCKDAATAKCLSNAQIDKVRKVYSPFKGPAGDLIYPAMQPGSEIMAERTFYSGIPFNYSQDWFRYVVKEDSSWDASTFSLSDAAHAEALNPYNIKTWPNDLSPFNRTGGKILSFHGGQDNQITSYNTERFYDRLSHGMKAQPTELDEFLRFFRISGMFHCNSGPGAWVLGQGGGASALGLPFDSKQNVLAALVEWVEKGQAPDTIEGTKFVNDTVGLGVAFKRRHCRYPLRNVYSGGDSTLPGNWVCRDPGIRHWRH